MPDENEIHCLTVEEAYKLGLAYDSIFEIRQPKSYEWVPQPDITTFELAQCLPAFFTGNIESLSAECKRHWKEQ